MTTRPITDYMTKNPHSIDPTQSIVQARNKMLDLGCKHLPVLSGRKIVGIVSDRDLNFVSELVRDEPEKIQVGEVMLTEVIKCDVSCSLLDIAKKMKENKVGSVVITKDSELEGIFTATDAVIALEGLLEA